MKKIKTFIKQTTEDTVSGFEYKVDVVDNCAEIFTLEDSNPVALVEFDGDVFHINFRCDLASQDVYNITLDLLDSEFAIIVGSDFYNSRVDGIVYGPEASLAYLRSMSPETDEGEIVVDASTFIVTTPIHAYSKYATVKKKWQIDLESGF